MSYSINREYLILQIFLNCYFCDLKTTSFQNQIFQGKNLFLGEKSFPVGEFTPIGKGSENEANSLPCKITLLL